MFSPAGQALLHGCRRSRYTGRSVRQVPVRLASEVPGLRVIANGLFGISVIPLFQQPILAYMPIGNSLQPCYHFRMCLLAEQVRETFLRLEVFLYWNLTSYLPVSYTHLRAHETRHDL